MTGVQTCALPFLEGPGRARETPGRIPESVTLGVAALAERWGADIIGRHRLKDDPDAMTAVAEEALAGSDLVVMTGGASVGEKEFAKARFASLGLEIIFYRAATQPGEPVWFGRVGGKRMEGLPG